MPSEITGKDPINFHLPSSMWTSIATIHEKPEIWESIPAGNKGFFFLCLVQFPIPCKANAQSEINGFS